MAETRAALAVADHNQRRKAEALAALNCLGDAIDVDELLDQLLAAVVVAATAATPIVAPATAAAAITAATPSTATAAAPAARTASTMLFGLRRGRLGYRCNLNRIGVGFVGLVFVLHSKTPVRL